jgi:lysyl-tRNA synthetase class 2
MAEEQNIRAGDNPDDSEDIIPEIESRMQTIELWKKQDIDPFGHKFERTHYAGDIHERYPSNEGDMVTVSGRMMAKRDMGKAAFLDLFDVSGKIQIFCSLKEIGEQWFKNITTLIHAGDFLGFRGEVFRTKMGEISIRAKEVTMLSKALRPMPEKWHGLQDIELRYRQRYLDLITNPESLKVFEARSRVIKEIRNYLDENRFIEVETPVFHKVASGAAAKPFETHHNALDEDFYLRISLELHLKIAMIGGIERVYEMSKVFRNEGMDRNHSPEYTMLELYQAYANYEDMMKIVEDIYLRSALALHGSNVVEYQGEKIDFTPPWPRLKYNDLMIKHAGIDLAADPSIADLQKIAKKFDPDAAEIHTKGKLIDLLFKHTVEDNLHGPIFVIDYPIEMSPLAKKLPGQDKFVYRFEAFILGSEMANAFTELNDPIDQRERFMYQMKDRKAGDDEAMPIDEEFVLAMEYGMPPAGGLGVGIDRMVMILMNQPSIRDVILFPLMK